MPRYEFSEGSSNKFWEIELKGTAFTTTYGKIGANGQTTIKQFKSEAEAKKEYDKIVAEKVKKGYQLVGGAAAPAPAPAPAPTKTAAKVAAKTEPATAERTAPQITPGARYFEFVEGTSSKFWEIRIEDESVITRYGKIGTAGQETSKDFDSKGDAFKEFDKLINEKTRKGYQERSEGGGGGGADKRNLELEKAITADPYDQQAWSVYADWLQGEGDPRGELIALQLAGKDKAAKDLLDKQKDYFLGPLAEHQTVYEDPSSNNGRENSPAWIKEAEQAFLWKHGFIHRLRLAHDEYSNEEFEGRLADVLDLVLRHPSGRFLVEIHCNTNGDPNDNDLQDILDILARKAPPTLRRLVLGDNVDQISWYNVGNLGKLWKAVPNLTTLEIEAGSFTLGAIDAPNLRKAIFKTGGLGKASGKSIAAASWPRLEHLEVYYGDDNYGGDCTARDVAPLLERTDLPALRYLGLKNSMFADDLCKLLGKSKLLRQLKTLDLSLGCMTDQGAAALVEHRDAFAHLDVLDVSENYLSAEGVKALKGLAKKVVSTEQRDDDDPEYRHPVVGE